MPAGADARRSRAVALARARPGGAPPEVMAALARLGIVGDGRAARFTPLSGGVSSDIWKVETPEGTVCVKRARPRLAVAAVWEVPVARNHSEAEFLRVAEAEAPGLAPPLLAEDRDAGLIVLPYLDPAEWSPWKAALMAGHVDVAMTAALGTALGRLVGRTLGRRDLALRFATDALFADLRLDPYLGEAARRHPDLAPRLQALAATHRRDAHRAGPRRRQPQEHPRPRQRGVPAARRGMRLVRRPGLRPGVPAQPPAAEVGLPARRGGPLPRRLRGASVDAYAAALPGGERARSSRRTARLLPGLLLARVDGKSPVEYLTDPERRAGRAPRRPPLPRRTAGRRRGRSRDAVTAEVAR